MTAGELDVFVERMRQKLSWVFSAQRDTTLSVAEVQSIEAIEKVQFPVSYKDYLVRYGAGDFAFGLIYSPDRKSDLPRFD